MIASNHVLLLPQQLNTIAERQEVLIAAVQQLGIKQVALDTAFAEIRGSRDHVRTMYKEVCNKIVFQFWNSYQMLFYKLLKTCEHTKP